MGFEADSAGIELAVEPFYVGFEKRPLDFDGQVADAQVKQLFVTETMPGESVAHGAHILAARMSGQKRRTGTSQVQRQLP